MEEAERFVDRLSRQGEEALGRIAEELIGNPVVNSALTRAFFARASTSVGVRLPSEKVVWR